MPPARVSSLLFTHIRQFYDSSFPRPISRICHIGSIIPFSSNDLGRCVHHALISTSSVAWPPESGPHSMSPKVCSVFDHEIPLILLRFHLVVRFDVHMTHPSCHPVPLLRPLCLTDAPGALQLAFRPRSSIFRLLPIPTSHSSQYHMEIKKSHSPKATIGPFL